MHEIEEGGRRPLRQKEIIDRLKQEMPRLQRLFGIKKIGLFGSYARNEAGEMSDIDLLVSFEGEKERFRTFMQCIFYLEDIFGKNVELIAEHALDPAIRPGVIDEVIWI
ncbi:nucleotidyltransferase family protein [Methanocalculus alkaliphilus]|uniref:nucleotidyltransferase family protein n=1 Tax=Methanocalculus alkaliphilus TaxID=768730 RepID=UPI0020A1A82D|nr:nucleotidyltransferase family protein [Methanocalculus alkaliphilus]